MTRIFKISLKTLGIISGLCVILWLALIVYVHYNKDHFANIITSQINSRISGDFSVENIEPDILHGFPNISFRLQNLVLRDSMWQVHKHDLLNIETAYVDINLWSALRKSAYLEKLTLTNGVISIYTDSNDISNTNIVKKKDSSQKEQLKNPLTIVEMDNIIFSVKHKVKKKDFVINIDNCLLDIKHNDTGWQVNTHILAILESFSFNTDVGSYMKDHKLAADLIFNFNDSTRLLALPIQDVTLNNFTYKLGSNFMFADTPYLFHMKIFAEEVPYDNVMDILTPTVTKKLKEIHIDKVDTVMVNIIGKMKYRDTPYVRAQFEVKNRTLTIPQGEIKNCSFNGFFLDEMVEGYGHGDENSMVNVERLKGNYYGIPFIAKNSTVTNLKDPILKTQISSDFKLPRLNNIIGINSFKFSSGAASVRLQCVLALKEDNKYKPEINGNVNFSNADFHYTPRNLDFKKASGKVIFSGADVAVNDLQVESGPNKITLNAEIKDLLNIYYTSPGKAVIDCKIRSKKVNLDEYTTLLGQRTVQTASATARNFARQLDIFMDESSVNIDMEIDEVEYKKFTAQKAQADIVLKKSAILLRDVHLQHSGGGLALNATIQSQKQSNKFSMDAAIKDMDVQKLFYAFKDFGQTAISDSNIRGDISADINLSGGIRYSGNLVPHSLAGNIKFKLTEGRLIDFEPLGTIGKIIFFNRDLSDITIEPLSGTLDVANNNIIINPLLIQTSAFNIFTEGVYGIPTGTNILVQIPLRNPKKDLNKSNKKLSETDLKKGIVFNLHATDDNTGKVKIKLGKGR